MNAIKEFVIPTAVLAAICLVISFALVFTNQLTAPLIAQAAKAEADAARIAVLPGADSFEALTVSEMPEGGVEIHKAQNGSGYVVTTQAKGYGGPLTVMTGIKSDGTIAAVKLLDNSETPGLGTKTGEEPFIGTFAGKDPSLQGVDTISGATISSTAFIKAVKIAFQVYAEASGAQVDLPEEPAFGLTPQKMAQFYPDVAEFTELSVEGGEAFRCGDKGYIVFGTAPGYYNTDLTVAVLFDAEDVILNVIVTEMNETEGLGSRVQNDEYRDQYVGKKDAEGIQAVTNATISSDAFKKAVRAAIARLPQVKEAQ
jgi:RnfABCDGE-type electron transport complex G subunit